MTLDFVFVSGVLRLVVDDGTKFLSATTYSLSFLRPLKELIT